MSDARDDEIHNLRKRLADVEHGRLSADPVMRSIAAATPDSVMLLDADGRIQFINRTAPGLSVEQVIGTSVYNYVPEDQHAQMRDCFAQVLATGEPGRYDNIYHPSDGPPSFWESRVGAVKEDGKITGLAVLASNVTERRDAAADRDLFFALSLDFYCVADFKGYFRRVNPSFERVLGWPVSELLRRPFIEFVHEDDRERTMDGLRRLSAGENIMDFTNRYRCKDGSYRTLSWRASSDSQAHVVYATARDITDRITLEEQLRQSQKMDAVGQLAGGIAHDFNNLLLVMMANAELAFEQLDRGKDPSEELRIIQRACGQARDLTKQILTFSRRQPLTTTRCDLNVLVEATLDLLKRVLPEHVLIDLIPGRHLPMIDADTPQMEQVIMNLCLNARDALPRGGHVTVETESVVVNGRYRDSHPWAKPGRYVLLSISDDGVGMSEEVRARAFEPFFTTKGLGQGTGLGLSTVYGIVQGHGGMVHLYSEPGRGTTFKLYLPASERLASEVGTKITEPVRGGGEVVLIAEDQPEVRKVVCALLRGAGYEVIEAADGKQAVELFRENAHRVALVLLDVVMPVMGGPEAAQGIQAIAAGTIFLFTSGYSEAHGTKGGLPMGASHLQKPYESHELLRAVRAAMDGGRPKPST